MSGKRYVDVYAGSSVAIFRDGEQMTASQIVEALNQYDDAQKQSPMSGERMTDAAMADALETASNRCHVQDVAALRKASAALRARPQAVAEGYALVPAEPTEAMLSVAVDNWSGYEEESGRFYTPLDSDIRILWNVMLAASQSATGGAT